MCSDRKHFAYTDFLFGKKKSLDSYKITYYQTVVNGLIINNELYIIRVEIT